LELLRTAQFEELGPPSPKSSFERAAFNSLVTSGGVGALPLLQAEAEQLGSRGQYPYAALASAANDAVAKEWLGNRQHAVEVLQSVFEPAFAHYSQSSPDLTNDYEFGEMLRVLSALPFETLQPALRMLVKNLLAADSNKYHYQAKVSGKDGQEFEFHNTIDAALLWFAVVIDHDPELVAQLRVSRPQIQAAFECVRTYRCESWFGRDNPQKTRPPDPDPDEAARDAAVRLSDSNPDLGIRNANGSEDNRKQLNIISAQASVAAGQNQQEQLRQLLERGFALAGPLVAEPQIPGAPPYIQGLPPMVQVGMQNYPEMTVDFLKNLSPVRMKAELLIGAAQALQLRIKLGSSAAGAGNN
jgi:hypothetical protein